MRRRTLSILAVCATLAVLTACTSDPKPSEPSTPPDLSAPTSSPTPTPSALSEQDQAVADAWSAYQTWNRTSVSCMKNPPDSYPTCFDNVSAGLQLESDRTELTAAQQDGIRDVGDIKVTLMDTISVDTTSQPAAVRFHVCRDLTGVDQVNAAGVSQLDPDLERHQKVIVTVIDDNYPDSTGWRVSNTTSDDADATCNG